LKEKQKNRQNLAAAINMIKAFYSKISRMFLFIFYLYLQAGIFMKSYSCRVLVILRASMGYSKPWHW
jgi:hypothetical protein